MKTFNDRSETPQFLANYTYNPSTVSYSSKPIAHHALFLLLSSEERRRILPMTASIIQKVQKPCANEKRVKHHSHSLKFLKLFTATMPHTGSTSVVDTNIT